MRASGCSLLVRMGASIPSVASAEIPRVMWLSGSGESGRSAELVTKAVDGQAVIVPKDLEVWGPDVPRDYGLQTETDAVARVAGMQGWDSFHLVGFSAGATVALAATLTLETAVQSLAIIEPATIGDDEWSAAQAGWQALWWIQK